MSPTEPLEGVAVIGLSGRFPGAADVAEFWRNLKNGEHSVSFFSAEELAAAGIDPARLEDPKYVKAGVVLDDVELFDASFFGFTPKEAEILDPQQRLFMECAWEAFENAGYDGSSYPGTVGVYAGVRISDYLMRNVYSNPEVADSVGHFQVILGNDKDYLATHVSYKLNLTGPSLNVQTACSTSLVAIHLASESLLNRESDLALAGGSTIRLPQRAGYAYEAESIFSPDGYCRPFDARAAGTIFGNGVGAVVLKRLEDAVADGDHIYAVIRGAAVNNDGAQKVGYTAPAVAGQAKVIADALAMAEVEPESLGYIECHGTGTALGDPIEITALNRVFESSESASGPAGRCAIGSVKSNIGHLEVAAGIAGFIKTALMLEHRQLVPTLHYEKPNPRIDFSATPFYVNTELRDWPANDGPRRAGVSSFGIGGTNAHVVLEEAPPPAPVSPSRPWQILALSARTGPALEQATTRLAAHLEEHPEIELADAAYTLQVGRRAFGHRRIAVCRHRDEAMTVLKSLDPERILTQAAADEGRPVVFLFPGQGAQYVEMGAELYRQEPTFKRWIDRCAEIAAPHLGSDLRRLLYPESGDPREAAERLQQTAVTQPALFAVEYALARLWMEWGIQPEAMLGHSIGEYVAACLAGVFSLEDAVRLVVERGRLIQSLPPGAMLGVSRPASEVEPLLGTDLDLAAVNAPGLSVVSGPEGAIDTLADRLAALGVEHRRLRTSHAFHSAMMEPILEPFAAALAKVRLNPPEKRIVSNLTGTWIEPHEATDPGYWVEHLRRTVRFSDGVRAVLREGEPILLEVGPGRTLSTLARRSFARPGQAPALCSLRHPQDELSDTAFALTTLGRLWLAGAAVDWPGFWRHERRRRVVLPTYPFERRRYWLEERPLARRPAKDAGAADPISELERRPPAARPSASGEGHPRPALATAYAAPRDELETRLVAIWQDLLGIEPVGVLDDFFELGGHSLLATRLLARVRQDGAAEISLQSFFARPTIAGLAELCTAAGRASSVPPLERAPTDGKPQLSAAQERLWFLRQVDPRSPAYNLPAFLAWEGGVDPAALTAAVNAVVHRHETLRCRFPSRDGSALAIIAPPAPVPLPIVDLQALTPAARLAEARRLSREEALRPFDVERGPLLRVMLITLDEEDHRLAITLDHLVADGWSFSVLWRESRELYAAAVERRSARLPALGVRYADYARWQRGWLEAPPGEDAYRQQLVGWWREELAGIPQVLDLPTDFLRPTVQGYRGFRLPFDLGEERSQALVALGQRRGATVFMTLLAAFEVLLGQTAGAERFLVGTNVANRGRVELEGLIGLFVNQIVLRAELGGSPTFEDLVDRVRSICLAAFAHQELPFEKLLEALEVERDLSRNPLFQVLFAVQNLPLALPDAEEAATGLERSAVRHDLRLEVLATTPRIHGVFEARTELFNPTTIGRLSERFDALISAVLEDPARPIDTLPRLAAAERHELLIERQAGAELAAPEETIAELFHARAAQIPDRVAVICGGAFVSYAALARRSSALATVLRDRGIGPESAVGIFLPRTPGMMVAVLGVLEAGGAYVPLDPGWPAERLRFLLDDSGVELVVSCAASAPRLPAGTVVDVDTLPADGPPALQSAARPDNAAYILYTSGSTGRPKGVVIAQRQLLAYVRGISTRLGLPAGTFALVQPLAVDSCKITLFPPLLSGGCLQILGAEESLDPVALRRAFSRHLPDVLKIAPSHLAALQTGGDHEGLIPRHRLIVGGEASPPGWAHELARTARSHHRSCRVFNHYGPTETAVGVLTSPVDGRDDGAAVLPVGLPLPGARVYVVDHALRPTPRGTPGQLLIGGVYLARGYSRRPGLTAAAFVPDPFSEAPGARLYCSGDLMRWGSSGQLEFLGRADHQVKIRGFRIELGEIVATLQRHPGVDQAVVLPRDGRLIAHVAAADPGLDGEVLRGFLSVRLPEHMVPATLVVLPELPRTAHGKLDLRALPEPEPESSAPSSVTAPRTPVERALAEIWAAVLGRPEIGVEDNFFSLGGDSLLSIQVVARANKAGLQLTIQQLFEHQTIAGLADVVQTVERGLTAVPAAVEALVALRSEGARPPLFLVHPAGGTIFNLLGLAHHLGDDQPVYAFQDPALFSAELASSGFDRGSGRTVEELAARYLEELEAVQSSGPYHLGGHSFGGVVAFEMACQLQQKGKDVALVALFDSVAPGRQSAEEPDDTPVLLHIVETLSRFYGASSPLSAEELRRLDLDQQLARAFQELAGLPLFTDLTADHFRRFFKLYRDHGRMSRAYRPRTLAGGLTLFRPIKESPQRDLHGDASRDSLALGWEALSLAPVEVVRVPGDHTTMLGEAHVKRLAERLRRCLEPVAAALARQRS